MAASVSVTGTFGEIPPPSTRVARGREPLDRDGHSPVREKDLNRPTQSARGLLSHDRRTMIVLERAGHDLRAGVAAGPGGAALIPLDDHLTLGLADAELVP